MTNRNIIHLPDLKEIKETAALWLMRLDDGDASEKTMLEFREWYSESKHHQDATRKLSSLWGGMELLADLNDMAASDVSVATVKHDRWPIRRPITRRLFAGAIAASFAVMIGNVGYQSVVSKRPTFQQAYVTAIGEQETVKLPDGSSIILNTDTIVNVEFTKTARHIYLEQGEAYFEVAKDKTKPFSVKTEQGVVTAVGTAFNVRVLETKMDVVVTEGRVALSALQSVTEKQQAVQPQIIMEVTAGQVVAFAHRVENLAPITQIAIERELDWRDGVLAFKGESLEEVVSNIGRYTNLSIDITGEDLRLLPIGGYFEVGEIEALFDALKIMADIEVERLGENQVRLYRNQ
ncbi:MAG: hypothetical protein COA69_08705 [Robiginitomaculum sp.]|nr:MAG: hypothetical protein COA69_08705 [Robiginitomaculum sp.]